MIGLFLFFTFAASQASSQSQVHDRNENTFPPPSASKEDFSSDGKDGAVGTEKSDSGSGESSGGEGKCLDDIGQQEKEQFSSATCSKAKKAKEAPQLIRNLFVGFIVLFPFVIFILLLRIQPDSETKTKIKKLQWRASAEFCNICTIMQDFCV